MPTHAEITEFLNRQMHDADCRLKEARLRVESIIAEVPGALPHPDGTHRIAIAIKERDSAREALQCAVKRSCDFTLYGIIPDELGERKD